MGQGSSSVLALRSGSPRHGSASKSLHVSPRNWTEAVQAERLSWTSGCEPRAEDRTRASTRCIFRRVTRGSRGTRKAVAMAVAGLRAEPHRSDSGFHSSHWIPRRFIDRSTRHSVGHQAHPWRADGGVSRIGGQQGRRARAWKVRRGDHRAAVGSWDCGECSVGRCVVEAPVRAWRAGANSTQQGCNEDQGYSPGRIGLRIEHHGHFWTQRRLREAEVVSNNNVVKFLPLHALQLCALFLREIEVLHRLFGAGEEQVPETPRPRELSRPATGNALLTRAVLLQARERAPGSILLRSGAAYEPVECFFVKGGPFFVCSWVYPAR